MYKGGKRKRSQKSTKSYGGKRRKVSFKDSPAFVGGLYGGTGRESFSKRKVASIGVSRSPSGAPDRQMCKLRYSQAITLAGSTGAAGVQVMRGNSLFDPDKTGTGTQPLYFDQWSAMYNNYVCYASQIKVTIVPTAGLSVGIQGCLAPRYSDNAFGSTDYDRAAQCPGAVTGEISQSPSIMVLKGFMTTARVYGVPNSAINIEDNYAALTSATPTNVWGWNILVCSADRASSITTNIWVEMTYYVEFNGRTVPAAS